MKKSYSKLSKNEPENIPQVKSDIFVKLKLKGFKKSNNDF